MKRPKSNPIPARLDQESEKALGILSAKTGIPKAELIRRCLRFALPKFAAGSANLLSYGETTATE